MGSEMGFGEGIMGFPPEAYWDLSLAELCSRAGSFLGQEMKGLRVSELQEFSSQHRAQDPLS